MQEGGGSRELKARALADALAGGNAWPISGLAGWWHWFIGNIRIGLSKEAAERRLFLWLPVFFGAGVLLYFYADREPLVWAPLVASGACLTVAIYCRKSSYSTTAFFLFALGFVFLGILSGCLKTARVDAPVQNRWAIAKVTAYVEAIDLRQRGARLLLRPSAIAGLRAKQIPSRIRVTMRWVPGFKAGATLSAKMRLLPPPRPSEPGGYDFAREAYFKSIGAVGNLVSRPVLVKSSIAAPAIAQFNAWIDRGRNWLTDRIIAVIGGSNGAVAAALVTGKRGKIPEEANEFLRAAGIYHIVSISGLHMVLAAGLFLWLFRGFMALFPQLALSRPIKTWAALCAMAGAIIYCIFSGAEVATQRALIMTLVMLGAVVFNRPAISMRNLAIAALIVLALDPNALLGPSFQMSFAAVAAMIAAFERPPGTRSAGESWDFLVTPGQKGKDAPPRDLQSDLRADPLGRIMLVLAAMMVTTLVASLATDPYAHYHFHRITPYGLLGNLMVLPLVEFIVMPAAMIGVLAAPFGLDGPVWTLMGLGIVWMMEAARFVAGLPGARILLPAFEAGALLLMTLGLLWLCLWHSWIRWAGLAAAIAGLALAVNQPKPDLLISGQARVAAFRAGNGMLAVLNAKGNRFGVAQWLASDADSRKPRDAKLAGTGKCDRSGCVARLRDGRLLALALTRQALAEDCPRADIVVSPLNAAHICKGPEKIYDRRHLAIYGATQIFLQEDGSLRQISSRARLYDRPWWRAPNKLARPAAAQRNRGSKSKSPTSDAGWIKAK